MIYKTVSLAFCASSAMGYSPAMPSKLASSRVARVSDIEMVKKSVRAAERSHAPSLGGHAASAHHHRGAHAVA